MRLAAPEGHPVIPAFVGQRILVAEDEPLITMELGRLLEEEGATVFAARSVSQAPRLVGTRALSAAVVDSRLGAEEADPLCEALGQRQVPFVFYTGQPDAPSARWPTAPVIGKPATAKAIVGAVKYVTTADRRDVLYRKSQKDHDPKVLTPDQHIADGEERIARVSCLITRLEAGGFDTSVARKLLATMTEGLDLMRRTDVALQQIGDRRGSNLMKLRG